MSHIATVDIEIKDLEALASACRELGLELVREQTQFRYYRGNRGDCVHAIRKVGTAQHSGAEIGIVANQDGRTWSLQWDPMYAGQLNVGHNCNKLRQQYAAATAIKTARARGMQVQQVRLPGGRIQLVCS